MPRDIQNGIDALFVEGPDDGAVVNALVKKFARIDLARGGRDRLVKVKPEGGGDSWALMEGDKWADERPEARVGIVVDRDRAENDKWPALRERLRARGGSAEGPKATGAIVGGQYGLWMWPDNLAYGGLEDFVAGIIPQSPVLTYAFEASRIARDVHGAEYELKHRDKAALKVRSIWRNASAAGGYGHLVRNLTLTETPALSAFMEWFRELFLT